MALRIAAACCLLLLAGCGGGDGGGGGNEAKGSPPNWPAPPNPMELTRNAGLVPERAEFLQYHVHAHLDVFFNGEPVTVPAGIGIDTTNPAVISDEQGAGLKRECDKPCIAPLHTHATDGVLHTETKTPQPNTLGQFFIEWDVRLDSSCVGEFCDPETTIAIYVDGEVNEGDPREIELSDGREIAVVIGSAPAEIPSEFPQ
jgi:hypothetical protein